MPGHLSSHRRPAGDRTPRQTSPRDSYAIRTGVPVSVPTCGSLRDGADRWWTRVPPSVIRFFADDRQHALAAPAAPLPYHPLRHQTVIARMLHAEAGRGTKVAGRRHDLFLLAMIGPRSISAPR